MAYKLTRKSEYTERERQQIVGALKGQGYEQQQSNNSLIDSYALGNSKAIIETNSITLSFDPNTGRDKEYFDVLGHIQHITGIRQVLVNDKRELRLLQSAGIESKFEEDRRLVRLLEFA